MLQFKNPEYFWLLLVVPFFVVLYVFSEYHRKKTLDKLGDDNLIKKLIPEYSKPRILLKNILFVVSMIFLIIAAARPQTPGKVKIVKNKTGEIIFALDVSNSMLAKDVKPDRLHRAKRIIEELYRKNKGNRIGLIVFAGQAFVQIPLTSDFSNSDIILSAITPEIIPVQGTNFTEAINLATNMFDKSNKKSQKLIIFLTDGENHEQKAIDAAKNARKNGIFISTVGIGKKSAVPVPDPKTGEYKKDKNGKVVLTKLNEVLLQQIANAGGGKYFKTGNIFSDTKKIQSYINTVGSENGKTEITEYADLFEYFISAGLFFLLLEFFLTEKRNKKFAESSIFK